MNEVINELRDKAEHELHQIGQTPRTSWNGTQEEHDEYHAKRAMYYQKAAAILTINQNT